MSCNVLYSKKEFCVHGRWKEFGGRRSAKIFKTICFFAEPPSAPQNLTVNFVDQSTVILSWNAPHMQGGRSDTTYRVDCDSCSMGVKYIPNTVSFRQNRTLYLREYIDCAIIELFLDQKIDARVRFDFATGDLQRHEDHDNRPERGYYLSLPSVRRKRRIVVGRQIGIRRYYRYNRGERAKSSEQRQDHKCQELRAQHQLGRARYRSWRRQRSRRAI